MHATDNLGNIQLTLAIKGDSPAPEQFPDAIGALLVGPEGLLNVLETQLGIPPVQTSFTSRLIQYLGCIEQSNEPTAFYHASYTADPFSVARSLLQWRDQWYMAGWRGSFLHKAPRRLQDMAHIEELASSAVDIGTGQRIQRVLSLLTDYSIAIASITLRDALKDFPHLWQCLIKAIQASGGALNEQLEPVAHASTHSDLGKLQRRLLSGDKGKVALAGDGTVLVLRADSPQASTPLAALLTQHWLSETPDLSIGLLAETRGDLLDETLEQTNSPRLGFTALSPWRPVFQVLPLACELLWEPLSPTAAFQFLSHPVGPIPARIRQQLARTVASTPGIGSSDWEQTIAASLDKEDSDQREKLRDSLRYWLEAPRFPPSEGVDTKTLASRAQRVADWLQGAREASDDQARKSLYNIALNQTLEFVNAIERLRDHGRKLLTQDNVRRLIEDVRGTGAPVADRYGEVAPGRARVRPASHSGAFSQPLDSIIWWDCQANDRVQRWPWSRSERAALSADGVILQSEDEQLAWLGKAWLRPILCARQRCTLVLHDDAERHHPIWDQIDSVAEGLNTLQVGQDDTVASLGIEPVALQPLQLPAKTRWWRLPSAVTLPTRDAESFSSLDSYIHSPYQWLLRYAGRIRPGSLASVSDGNLLKGNLAHKLYEVFFNAHPQIVSIDPASINDWVDSHIDVLLEQEGALLLEPGRQAECERFITQVSNALLTLVEQLHAAAVVSVQMELWQEGRYVGGNLNGSIDLLATRADGREAVIDIKWGGRSYRRKALLNNSYLQLATYAQLRCSNGAKGAPALSYFIVVDAHMLSLNHDFFPNAEILTPTGGENDVQYWQRFEHSWQWRKEQMDNGRVEMTVTGTEPTEDSSPPDGSLTIPIASDSFNDYRALTGWEGNA